MAKKPETRLIQKVHQRLPTVTCEKNNNPYRHGQADCCYYGERGSLLIEYKLLTAKDHLRMRKRIPLDLLSIHQAAWLYSRFMDNMNVAVFVGLSDGKRGLYFPGDSWVLHNPSPITDYPEPISLDALANTIHETTGDSPCQSSDFYSMFLAP